MYLKKNKFLAKEVSLFKEKNKFKIKKNGKKNVSKQKTNI